ncbi:hypothetical protein AGOR_G00244090 [Albula goreensis]|uniref:Uncharacterized protein n=1 Tax=Albula goreensis TaxID=1534307 RepID=A0A8T3CH18_9TELE|nr:hypothetical protein AGOR_G00244090 [Albula goreensis]
MQCVQACDAECWVRCVLGARRQQLDPVPCCSGPDTRIACRRHRNLSESALSAPAYSYSQARHGVPAKKHQEEAHPRMDQEDQHARWDRGHSQEDAKGTQISYALTSKSGRRRWHTSWQGKKPAQQGSAGMNRLAHLPGRKNLQGASRLCLLLCQSGVSAAFRPTEHST